VERVLPDAPPRGRDVTWAREAIYVRPVAKEAAAAVRVLEAAAGATPEQLWTPRALGTIALQANGLTLDRWREYLELWQQFAEVQHDLTGVQDGILEVARKFAYRVELFAMQYDGECTLEEAAEMVLATAHYCTQPATRTTERPRFTPAPAPIRHEPRVRRVVSHRRETRRQPRRARVRVTRGPPAGPSRSEDDPDPEGLRVGVGTWQPRGVAEPPSDVVTPAKAVPA
jgi:hypothetical protein